MSRRRVTRISRWAARLGQYWADRSIATKGLVLLALPSASLLALVMCTAALAAAERQADAASARAEEAERATGRLMVGLLNGETGVRGFLLTGDAMFLDPYDTSQEEIPTALADLERLAVGVPFGSLVRTVRERVTARQRHWRTMIDSHGAGSSAVLPEMLGQGRRLMDDLRASLDELRAFETAPLERAARRRQELRTLQAAVLTAGLFVGLGVGTASALLFLGGIARRVKHLETNARELEAGRVVSTPPSRGRDEIGSVALALHRASRLLRRREEALREAATRVQDLYDRAPCGYHSLNADGVFVEVNETELAWLGRTRDEVVGRLRFSDVLTPESRALFAERFPRFRRDGRIDDVEFDIVSADGARRPVSLSATAILDADGQYVVSRSTMFDITERRQADEARRSLNERLSTALAEQQTLNRELEAFSYSVSHDLRAPLRTLDGFSQVLIEDYAAQLDDEGRHYLARMRAGAQRLGTLIDDLLGLARVTRTTLDRRPVDLSALAQSVIADLPPPEPLRRVQWRVADGLEGGGDRVLLRMLLQNLLGNALKFTAHAADATIEFGMEQAGGARAYFVRDNGAGFDMQYADKLFGVFQRLHTEQEFPGTGVGLATVQRIVHKHGGRVWAEGRPGAGATFWFTLSLDDTDQRQELSA